MQNKINPAIAALIVIVLIGAATAGVVKLNEQPIEKSTSSDVVGSAQSNSNTSSGVKDGTYTADGTYPTPGDTESIGVTVTLKNGIIEDVTLEQHARHGDAAEYQAKFASGYKSLVKGKNINDVQLDRVAGSSLTSEGFNQALESIKRDAAA